MRCTSQAMMRAGVTNIIHLSKSNSGRVLYTMSMVFISMHIALYKIPLSGRSEDTQHGHSTAFKNIFSGGRDVCVWISEGRIQTHVGPKRRTKKGRCSCRVMCQQET